MIKNNNFSIFPMLNNFRFLFTVYKICDPDCQILLNISSSRTILLFLSNSSQISNTMRKMSNKTKCCSDGSNTAHKNARAHHK